MKRIMALIAVLILLSTACAESYPAYVWGDDGASFALLLDADGTILTPVDQYAMIYPITDDGDERTLFCAAILDEDGEFDSCVLMNDRGGNPARSKLSGARIPPEYDPCDRTQRLHDRA